MIPVPTLAAADVGVAAAPPPLSISLVGSRAVNTGTSTLSVTQPSGVAAGDVGILRYRSSGTVTAPSGWSFLASGLYYRVYTGGEGTISLNTGSSANTVAVLGVFRNVHNASPIDASSSRSTTGTSHTSDAITAAHDRSMLVSGIILTSGTTGGSLTIPSGFTSVGTQERQGRLAGIAYSAPFSNGAGSGTPTWTSSVSASGGDHSLIFLRVADS